MIQLLSLLEIMTFYSPLYKLSKYSIAKYGQLLHCINLSVTHYYLNKNYIARKNLSIISIDLNWPESFIHIEHIIPRSYPISCTLDGGSFSVPLRLQLDPSIAGVFLQRVSNLCINVLYIIIILRNIFRLISAQNKQNHFYIALYTTYIWNP